MSFNYKINLPYHGDIRINPLTMGQYKTIIQFIVNKDYEGLVSFVNALVGISLVKLDILVLLLQWRKISRGTVVDLVVEIEKGKQPVTYQFDMDDIIKNVCKFAAECKYVFFIQDGLYLVLKPPREFKDKTTKDEYIHGMSGDYTAKRILEVALSKIPSGKIDKAYSEFKLLIKSLTLKYPLIEIPINNTANNKIHIDLYGYDTLNIIQYVYGEDLDGIYEQIFSMMYNLKFSAEFINNEMTPMEANLYIAKYNKMMKKQQDELKKNSNQGHMIGTPQSLF